jgi:hypothetical protein
MPIIRKLFSGPEGINMRGRMSLLRVEEPDGRIDGQKNRFNRGYLACRPTIKNPNQKKIKVEKR